MTLGIAPPSSGGVTRSPRNGQAASGLLAAWRWPVVAALVFLLAHVAFLSPTLDDIDAVNFAFGVRSFDPAEGRPHPPGYPVYIALGKLSAAVVDTVRPASSPIRSDNAAIALAFWSALFGAVGLLACYAVFLQLHGLDDRHAGASAAADQRARRFALSAAVLASAAPLAWFSASRPMSDVPGLAAATLAQAFLLHAWHRESRATTAEAAGLGQHSLAAGALIAGIALGIRSQVLWLTLPLLLAVVVARARRRALRRCVWGVAAYGAGIVMWTVPMIVATGGLDRYLGALRGQGAEDFSGVDMLWTHFGARRLVVGLWQTFVLPWSSLPLALLVLALAAAGFAVMFRRARVALGMLVLLVGPYAIFHSLFHETLTTRYALPLVPAVCYLAARALPAARGRLAVTIPAALVAACLAVGVPAIRAYASAPSPFFQALGEMQRHPDVESGSVHVLAIHAAARLPLRWASEITPWSRRLPSPRHAEWQEAVKVLREEPGAAVWFLGETSRRGELRFRDLALIDPRGQQPVRHFSWPFDTTGLLDGIRPALVDLYEVRAPGWIATDGWALTPETAGVAKRDHRGPAYGPIEALVRRREGDGVLLLGGRHLGTAADGPGRVEVAVDGRTIADFPVSVTPKFFLRLVPLPAGSLAGDGVFARLAVRVLAPDGTPRAIPIAIEQFDVDSADGLVYGYDAGWQEAEYDPGRQIQWRWMSERATILVHAGVGGPLTLSLTAESPRKYFDRAPAITVRVGDTRLAHLVPDARVPRLLARATGGSTFSLSVPIDREALARASNRVTLEADQYFTPAARDENADQRHLSMRVLELSVTRAAR